MEQLVATINIETATSAVLLRGLATVLPQARLTSTLWLPSRLPPTRPLGERAVARSATSRRP